MQIKLSKALEIRNKIATLKQKPIPGVITFRLAKMLKPIREAGDHFDEAQLSLLKQYGAPAAAPGEYHFVDDDGKFSPTAHEHYTEALKLLLAEDVEVDTSTKLSQADLERVELSINEVEALELFVA